MINKFRWDARFQGEACVHFVDRYERETTLTVCRIADITRVTSHYFTCRSGTELKYIPLHRVVKITYEGREVWVSKRWVEFFERAA